MIWSNIIPYIFGGLLTLAGVGMSIIMIHTVYLAFFAARIKKNFLLSLEVDYYLTNDLKYFEVVAYLGGKPYILCRIPIARYAYRKEFLRSVLDEANKVKIVDQFPVDELPSFPKTNEEE